MLFWDFSTGNTIVKSFMKRYMSNRNSLVFYKVQITTEIVIGVLNCKRKKNFYIDSSKIFCVDFVILI